MFEIFNLWEEWYEQKINAAYWNIIKMKKFRLTGTHGKSDNLNRNSSRQLAEKIE